MMACFVLVDMWRSSRNEEIEKREENAWLLQTKMFAEEIHFVRRD